MMFQDAISSALQTVDASRAAREPRDAPIFDWTEMPGMILRRAGWIAGSVGLALLAGLMLITLLPPSYTADTEIVVQPTDLKAVDGSVNQVSNQPDTSVALLETASQVIGSRKVLEQVVQKLGLASDPEFVRKRSLLREFVGDVRVSLGIETDPPAADPMDDALRELSKHIAIRRPERTFVIDLSVRSKDPLKAARIANAIVEAFLDVQAGSRADASRRISNALTSRLGELTDSVRRSEDAVQQFRVANNLVMANGQMVGEQQLSDASNQLLAAENRTADAKSKLDQIDAAINGRDPGAIPESLQSPTIAALRSQLALVTRQEADARVTLGDRHPALLQMRSQVEAARRSIDAEVQRIRASARGEYDRARGAEATLRANLGRQQDKAATSTAAQVKLRELERNAEASRSVLEAFQVRARETAEQERVNTFNAWVISPAVPPSERSFPPPNLVVLGAALVLGLAAGFALAFVREQTDVRLWTRGRVESVTGMPVLATLLAATKHEGPTTAPNKPIKVSLSADHAKGGDDMAGVLQELAAVRTGDLGRVILLLGAEGEADAGLAADRLAAAAEAEGLVTTLVHFDPAARPAAQMRLSDATTGGGDRVKRLLDLPEPAEPCQVPAVIARLKTFLAQQGAGRLLVIPVRRGSPALSQLTMLADATVLVLTLARSTREDARVMAGRLKSKANALRGAFLIQRTA